AVRLNPGLPGAFQEAELVRVDVEGDRAGRQHARDARAAAPHIGHRQRSAGEAEHMMGAAALPPALEGDPAVVGAPFIIGESAGVSNAPHLVEQAAIIDAEPDDARVRTSRIPGLIAEGYLGNFAALLHDPEQQLDQKDEAGEADIELV